VGYNENIQKGVLKMASWSPGRVATAAGTGGISEIYKAGGGTPEKIFGGSGDPGALGVGKYKATGYDINKNDFEKSKQIKDQENSLRAALASGQRFKDPQAQGATIDQSQQWEWKERQRGLADALTQQSMGQGPSLAGAQLSQARDQNIATQMALAASGRGVNPALAQRQVANQAAMAGQQAARDSATMRIQEQLAARQQLAGVTEGARAQDIGLATSQAGLTQQANLANQQAALDAERIRNQSQQFYEGALVNQGNTNRQAMMDYNQLQSQQALGIQGINAGAYNAAAQNRGQLASGVGTGIAAAFSDENLKTDITEVGKPTEKKFADDLGDWQKYAGVTEKDSGHSAMGKTMGAGLGKALQSMGGAEGATAALAASDKNAKTNVSNADGKMKGFLDALTAYEYKYKDPRHGEGKFVSPMAQDLEKTEIGKQAVIDTPEGKMVDYGKLGGAMLASQSMLNDRISDLEKALKARGKKSA
jgi:hypothetical protein